MRLRISFSKDEIGSWLVGLSALSTFSPLKIYPILFVVTAIYLFFIRRTLIKASWCFWLWLYIAYALAITSFTNGFQLQDASVRTPITAEAITNLAKLVIGAFFLTAVINWVLKTDGSLLRRSLDRVLLLSLLLTLAQLLVYISHQGLSQIVAESSAAASHMYDPKLCFWGIADKNILGARIALFGFLYLINYFISRKRLPFWRSFLVFLCAFLSNSRTPMAALFIGMVYLLYKYFGVWKKVVFSLCIAAISPFLVLRLFRFDSLLDSGDGMGIRIIYWLTFFRHFTEISVFGRGFMSGKNFLSANAPFYLGEPHLHNLFLNNYLDFGVIGFVAYIFFLVSFYSFCKKTSRVWFEAYWIAAFLPILAIMATLSTGYESDTFIYLAGIYATGHRTKQLVSRPASDMLPEIELSYETYEVL